MNVLLLVDNTLNEVSEFIATVHFLNINDVEELVHWIDPKFSAGCSIP